MNTEQSPFSGPREIMIPTPAGAYHVAPMAADGLKKCAKPLCYRCKGTGISGWKRGGFRAVICKCAQANWKMLSGQSPIKPPSLDPIIVQAAPNTEGKKFILGPDGTVVS